MRARRERAGVAIGVVVALAIMWAILGFALIKNEPEDPSRGGTVIYNTDRPSAADEDDDR
jgi:hypothetical protein